MSKRLPELATPFTKTRKSVTKFFTRAFENFSFAQRFWAGFAFLCILTTLMINNPFWRAAGEQYKEGDIARESIISPADITVTDEEATEARKNAAREKIPPIFRLESNKAEQAVQRFTSAWEKLQRHDENLSNANERTSNKPSNSDAKTETHWIGAGGAEVGKVLASRNFSRNELDAVLSALRESSTGYIYDDADRPYFQTEVSVIDRSRPNVDQKVSMPETNWIALSTARHNLRERLESVRSLSLKEINAFYTATELLIEPSVAYDSAATESARESAANQIAPVKISLKRTQKIADGGDIVTPEILSKITAIRSYSQTSRQVNRFFGLLAIISALFWAAWKFIQHNQVGTRLTLSGEKTFALFGFIIIVQTALMAMFFRLAEFSAAQNPKPPLNDPMLWSFMIPFATGSLLLTLLADRRTALFTGLFLSLIAGLLAPKNLEFALFSAIASAVAVYGIGRYRSRQSVTIAGVFVGLASAAAAVALIGYTQQPFILNTVLWSVALGLGSGLITAAVTAVMLPLCESIFGILTDVKLLELSNADLPVLGQLALRAPGTNQHSHAVGQLAEEACRVVGANGLLARIGALYHDIGKTAAPEHFVENQMGKNPHDKLKPTQSSKIIISHVTYGIKLAKEIGLPQRIIDFIPQHHGTRTLHYFLRKAQAEARSADEISENDFRYPGPKPQFKEAAIMMIADSCEAAARSLDEPNPENIRFIVTKIIDAIVSDDQLDECDLTLRELTMIRESMIKSLVSIYHSRVDYPGYTPPNSMQRILVPKELLDSEERGLHYQNPAEIPISKGGEVEDEAIDRSQQPDQAEAKTVH
ncbi:MAG TPA: HDIG domain-containing metalloprotein [Pyrinomonadaceae bacterium]|jgi:putative nucleotidyltransferase with HDIG domain